MPESSEPSQQFACLRVKSRSIRRDRKPFVHDIPDVYLDKADEGIRRELESLGRACVDAYAPITGNKHLKKKSLSTYETKYRALRYFFCMIGDYQSLIILLKNRPDRCPAMSPMSLALLIRWKRGKFGSPLLNMDNEHVRDVNGVPINCTGDWKDPDNVKQLTSAVGACHQAAGLDGLYIERCADCHLAWNENSTMGCQYHLGHPNMWRKGNPCTANLLKNEVRRWNCEGADYEVRGDSPLTPWEVVSLRHRLCSSGNLMDLCFFTIVIIAIKLFLRSDEFVNIKFEDIRWDLTSFQDDGNIHGLVVEIKGKSDNKKKPFVIWSDDKLPVLCPIRHLLVYLYCSGITEGYLFPTLEKLINIPSDGLGKNTSKICYPTFLEKLKNILKTVTKRNAKWGTHTFRKTAYLFAVWGGASDTELLPSARHTNIKTALVYKKDAATLKKYAERHRFNEKTRCTPEWKPIFFKDCELTRFLNPFSEGEKSLYETAAHFCENILKYGKNHRDFSVFNVLNAAMNHTREMNIAEKLDSLLNQIGNKELAEQIADAIQENIFRIFGERQEEISRQRLQEQEETKESGNIQEHESALPTVGKRKRGGSLDLMRKDDLRKLKGLEKFNLIKQQYEECHSVCRSQFTESSRNIIVTAIIPIMKCFDIHFQKNQQHFIQKWSKLKYKHSKFNSLCNGQQIEACKVFNALQ